MEVIFRIRLFPQSPTNTFPFLSTTTPEGLVNIVFVPVPSANPAVLLPANVLTVTTGEGNLPAVVTANVAAVILVLVDDPADPQDSTTPDGFASVNEDASHFTQEETLKAEDPLGRLDNKGEETYEPLAIIRAALGYDVELV